MFSPSFTGSLQWQKTFSVSIFFVLFVHLLFFSWEMFRLFLNTVIKMLSHSCHNKKLLFRALFIADSHCECHSKQATVTIIWLLLHIGIVKCNLFSLVFRREAICSFVESGSELCRLSYTLQLLSAQVPECVR